jgi:hypothetical protein
MRNCGNLASYIVENADGDVIRAMSKEEPDGMLRTMFLTQQTSGCGGTLSGISWTGCWSHLMSLVLGAELLRFVLGEMSISALLE